MPVPSMLSDVDPALALQALPVPGDRIADKYELVRLVGEGGMGAVFEAIHLRLRQRVAIKILLPKAVVAKDVVARFEREGRIASQLKSRHATRVLDIDVSPGGLPYMVMEYLEGRTLSAELRRRKTLSVPEAIHYMLQACDAMAEAHSLGIVHRDLKPSNLFLCPENDTLIVKVLDFGISKILDDSDVELTHTREVVGTPMYMSPEQVRSAKLVDARTDIWSLGVILYKALAGRAPFEGPTPTIAVAIVTEEPASICQVRPDVPPELEAAVFKALEKDPHERYQDVITFAAALQPFAPAVPPAMPSFTPLPLGASSSSSSVGSTRLGPTRAAPPLGPTRAVAPPNPLHYAETQLVADHDKGPAASPELLTPQATHQTPPPATAPSPKGRAWLGLSLGVGLAFGVLCVALYAFLGARAERPVAGPIASGTAPVATPGVTAVPTAPAQPSGQPTGQPEGPITGPIPSETPAGMGPAPQGPAPPSHAGSPSHHTPRGPSQPAPKPSANPLFIP